MLNPQQEIFAELYLKYGNATKAYKGAGYTGTNPGQCAHELLKNPDMKAYIEGRHKAMIEKFSVSREEIVQHLTACMRSSVKDLFDDEDKPLEISDMTVETAGTITSVDFMLMDGEDGKKKRVIEKIRRVDKLEAIKELSKMLGFNGAEDPNKNRIPLTIDEIEIVYSNPATQAPDSTDTGTTTTDPEPPKTQVDAD